MNSGIPRIYQDGTYLTGNPTWHAEDSQQKAEWIARLIERHGLRPATICEIGCGAGEILNQLSQTLKGDIAYHGYEPSPQAFELCRSRQRENLRFYCRDLPEDGASYDLVLVIDVLEHVEDYRGLLRALKGKGRHTILRIPLSITMQSVLFKSAPILRARQSFGHLHDFTAETVRASLEDTGYRILDADYTYGPFPARGLGLWSATGKSLKRLLLSLHREWAARLLDGYSLLVLAE